MSKSITEHVRECIIRTKENFPVYFQKCIKQRLIDGSGSFYLCNDPVSLEETLMSIEWEKYEHPNIAPDCHGYISHGAQGFVGVLPLEKIPEDSRCILMDPKGCGRLSLCVSLHGKRYCWSQFVDYTVLITGDDGYGECMFTFHPGDPLKPSTLSSDGSNEHGLKDGDEISVESAISLGFKHAKLIHGEKV